MRSLRIIQGLCFGLIIGTSYPGISQQMMGIRSKTPTICYAHSADNPCYIVPPESLKLLAGGRTKTSTIEVTYNPGFTQEAINAFEFAIDIWESLISSPVPIKIDAYWSPLGTNVLGGALYTSAFANFTGAQKLNTFYPVALAEKITGQNLNGNEPDIFVQFNSNSNWNFNPNQTTIPSGQFDLVTVVLHEIGHGLGFSGTFTASATSGQVGLQGSGIPIIYDIPIENGASANLIRTFASPSADMGNELRSDNLFFNTPTSTRPKLYAPATFSSGSSISHLDENSYNSTGNALMTPFIAPQEQLHSPGIAWNMLKDMGWEFVRIVHQPLTDRENVTDPFLITATLQADNGYNASSVKLFYTLNGTTFTSVAMTPTGNPNQFSGSIPSTGNPQQYGYYLSVSDNSTREFVNPGKFVRKQNSELQHFFTFQTGPDTKGPIITHSPKPFLLPSESLLEIRARVSDNIGIASVTLEYLINNVLQPIQLLTLQSPGADSIYSVTVDLGTLNNGDEIKYKITATDNSSNSNRSFSPSSDYHVLNVVGLEPTQASYANNFNSPSNDFFGNGFSIIQPTGFADGAIHSTHPYPEGNGNPNNELNFIYQLKIPIRVKATEALIRFDEIVLVEPGEPGTVFGQLEFWDYVVVEGSTDGGVSWIPIGDGYDSQANSAWLTRYNSAISGNNSTAVGDPTLFRSRTIDLQTKFDTDDEVVIRFRLYSDPFAAGWGWAIDNLKIQIDDIPPRIQHDHYNYLKDDEDELIITTKVTDASGIETLKIVYRINQGATTEQSFVVNPLVNQYTFTLAGLSALSPGDLVEYQIFAKDSAGNENTLPAVNQFVQVPVINFTGPVSTYANNFNSASSDFVGNFFSVLQPTGFTTSAIHTTHKYPLGFGLNGTSSFSYTLLKPLIISSTNTYMRFDEIVIVEGHNFGVAFGTPEFKDYVVVEGSKDGGQTWLRFLDGYDILGGLPSWAASFASGGNADGSMFRSRLIDLRENGNFQAGDQVLIRFRLFSNETINGWGWAIDNLFIQDPITGIENSLNKSIKLYPNPVVNHLVIESDAALPLHTIQVYTTHGQLVGSHQIKESENNKKIQLDLSNLPPGLYLLTLQGREGILLTRKILKVN